MITEDYVSYGVAKLLKEKGFDEFCGSIYIILPNGDYRWSKIDYPHKNSVDTKPTAIMCPTCQMAMKWLRKKGIDIIIMPVLVNEYNEKKYYVWQVGGTKGKADTFEEAVNATLKYSLENLI